MHTVLVTTPNSHAAQSGHWDLAEVWHTPIESDPGPGPAVVLLEIRFQNGPVKEHGVNGVQLADVLKICLARYRMLNETFRCRENSIAITKIQEAIMWDEERTAQRTLAGVEGKDEPR